MFSRLTIRLPRSFFLGLFVTSSVIMVNRWSFLQPVQTSQSLHELERWEADEIQDILDKYAKFSPRDIPVSDNDERPFKNCTPHHNILLLKTHKTGSSTLQNILYRYGDRRDLLFALPSSDNYFGSPFYFKKAYVMKMAGNVEKYNILANHARYKRNAFAEVMPADTVFITSIRHPVTQYESLYKYYRFSNRFHQPVIEFAKDPARYYDARVRTNGKTRRQAGVNPMLFDLGLHQDYLQDTHSITEQIREIDRRFALVLVAEYFDESLILLKDLLCWDVDDIVYFRLNARIDEEVEELSEEAKHNLTVWNSGDVRLYEHFNRTLWRKIKEYGLSRMKAEIAELHEVISKLEEKCLDGDTETYFPGLRTAIRKYEVKGFLSDSARDFCESFTRKPQEYMQILKRKMRDRFGYPDGR